MPEKSQSFRAKRAKKQGTVMKLKASDVHETEGLSTHRAKKIESWPQGNLEFADRSVSPRQRSGQGLTAKGVKLPLPETGSSTSRRKTLPAQAAVGYRKEGRRKLTTGRGDVKLLQASKRLTRISQKRSR
jgi:FtsZ-interacting cell division protein ZipA